MAWIPATKDRVVVQRGRQDDRDPQARRGSASSTALAADAMGQRLAVVGWNAGTYDSVGWRWSGRRRHARHPDRQRG